MVISAEPLIYGLIFLAVMALVQGLYLTVFGKSISLNSKFNRRMEMLEKGAGREQVLEQLRKEMSQHMSSKSIPLYAILADKAQKANIAFTPGQLVMVMGVMTVVAFFLLTFGTGASLPIRLIVSVAMGVGSVFVWVNKTAKKRLGLLEEQLPDAVELMVRSLRVGHPFTSALQIVAREVPDPLGTEMGVISDEAAYGRDVGEALKHMAERIDQMQALFAQSATHTTAANEQLAEAVGALSNNMGGGDPGMVVQSQERLSAAIEGLSQDGTGSFDAESRMRLRSMDVQMLRILEEISAGRQESMGELRADIAQLTKAIRLMGRRGPDGG